MCDPMSATRNGWSARLRRRGTRRHRHRAVERHALGSVRMRLCLLRVNNRTGPRRHAPRTTVLTRPGRSDGRRGYDPERLFDSKPGPGRPKWMSDRFGGGMNGYEAERV